MTTPLEFLVLGGTSWLGGAAARRAVERGHRVTCLARGRSGDVPPGARLVRADRWEDGGYDGVLDRDWDAVLDVTWQPDLVRSALAALDGRARHWLYVSSVSVYPDATPVDSMVTLDPWRGAGEAPMEQYGHAKVSCETSLLETVGPDRLLVARAGLIAGYGDRSDRFGYWPARVARVASDDEVVLVPPTDLPVQVIDAEDLADWLVRAAESRTCGIVDAVGDPVTFADVLHACTVAADVEPTVAEPESDWLLARGVNPWMGPESLALWLAGPEELPLMRRPNKAAKEAGLRLRPLAETVAGALAWEQKLGLDRERQAGLTPQREAELLTELLG